jgi:hypothetical protein
MSRRSNAHKAEQKWQTAASIGFAAHVLNISLYILIKMLEILGSKQLKMAV